MMARVFSSLIFLIGLINVTNSQFGACDYFQKIKAGKSYQIFSPNYSLYYAPNSSCRWTAKSDRPIHMTCNDFQIPRSPECITDLVIIRSSKTNIERYCGTLPISIVSQGNEITVELHSSSVSRGGRFLCTIQPINITTDLGCRCGWKNPTRIVGGVNTGVNEYTMMAGLVDFINKIVFCGATIINSKQVLTAAHCVYGRVVEDTGVIVGEHDISIGSETNAMKLLIVTKIIIHPQYSVNSEDDDIALVDIRGSIIFNLQVGPVCLPIQHSRDSFAGNLVDILGWGSIGAGEKMSNILQKAQVSVITNAQCARTYRGITATKLCTLSNNKDSCQHDSGGPVLWRNPTTGRIILTSIITSGGICADGNPSINTRVGSYVNWILSQTPRDFLYCAHE